MTVDEYIEFARNVDCEHCPYFEIWDCKMECLEDIEIVEREE